MLLSSVGTYSTNRGLLGVLCKSSAQRARFLPWRSIPTPIVRYASAEEEEGLLDSPPPTVRVCAEAVEIVEHFTRRRRPPEDRVPQRVGFMEP